MSNSSKCAVLPDRDEPVTLVVLLGLSAVGWASLLLYPLLLLLFGLIASLFESAGGGWVGAILAWVSIIQGVADIGRAISDGTFGEALKALYGGVLIILIITIGYTLIVAVLSGASRLLPAGWALVLRLPAIILGIGPVILFSIAAVLFVIGAMTVPPVMHVIEHIRDFGFVSGFFEALLVFLFFCVAWGPAVLIGSILLLGPLFLFLLLAVPSGLVLLPGVISGDPVDNVNRDVEMVPNKP